MRVTTWNVNSIKVRKEQVAGFLRASAPDVLLLQELKGSEFPRDYFPGYYAHVSAQRALNGVAALVKEGLPSKFVTNILPGFDEPESRYLEIECCDTIIIDVYVPVGQSLDSESFQKKLHFLSCLENRLRDLLPSEKKVIVGGDFNVAIAAVDTYAELEDSVCCAAAARSGIRSILNLGYYDVYRALNPGSTNFSWWDYRSRCFERNMGMRLDYFLVSPQVVDVADSCHISAEYRALEQPSDHVPVTLGTS